MSTLAVAIVNHVAEDPEEKLFQINEGTLGIYWRKARSIAGITDANFHDLRHTAITRFARSGKFNVLELAAISGHKNLQYLKRYTHLLAEDLAAKILNSSRTGCVMRLNCCCSMYLRAASSVGNAGCGGPES